MSKSKTAFFCRSCGYESPKWLGKCPSCGTWNSFEEELIHTGKTEEKNTIFGFKNDKNIPHNIADVPPGREEKNLLHDAELNRVLGGGLVQGSVVLIGGEPGIGKSTLLLQNAINCEHMKILYVSGEESEQQVKMRAMRMPGFSTVDQKQCYIYSETNTQNIFKQIQALEPNWVIVDSIQTMESSYIESAAGSISQVKQCTSEFIKYAKQTDACVFLIGHINKDGLIAGPKVLEHMVDTVLQFEGDRHLSYRVVRTLKNRFGSAYELGIYEMTGNGLRQISNPSEILITQHHELLAGVAIGSMMEGNRPLFVEIQSLVSNAVYGTPQRTSTGFDAKRLSMLLAILEKRGGFRFGQQDVFLNVTGGLRVEDPSIDLAVCASLISSYENTPISPKVCFIAEVGLGGELRAVSRLEQRLSEAQKLGFEEVFVSKYNQKTFENNKFTVKIHFLNRLDEAVASLFG